MPNASPAVVRAQLREITFLAGLTDGDYHYLSSHIDGATYACDDTIFQEGEKRALFALIIEGAVAIEKHAGGRRSASRPSAPARRSARGCCSTMIVTARPPARSRRRRRCCSACRSSRRSFASGQRSTQRWSLARHARSRSASRRRTRRSSAADEPSASAAAAPASSTTSSASARFPTTRCTASRRCAPSRTFRSPTSRCAISRRSFPRSRR